MLFLVFNGIQGTYSVLCYFFTKTVVRKILQVTTKNEAWKGRDYSPHGIDVGAVVDRSVVVELLWGRKTVGASHGIGIGCRHEPAHCRSQQS